MLQGKQLNSIYQLTQTEICQQYMGKGLSPMGRTPRWAFLIAGILIVMSCLLGATIVFVLLEMIPRGMDIQMPLLYIIVPLIAFIALIVPITAFVLTRKKEQSLLV